MNDSDYIREKVIYRAACEIVARDGEIVLTLFELSDDTMDAEAVLPLRVLAPGAVVSAQRMLSLRDLIRSRGDALEHLLILMKKAVLDYVEDKWKH